ncbi:MAG: thiamine phosphate synthase [Mariprofundus sp.]|nr:thiamine phosphate synthase [Mariprofundus sp.]
MLERGITSRLEGIYGILPAELDTADLLAKAESALKGGVRILQFRDKKQGYKRQLKRARALRQLSRDYGALLIINDSVRLAQDADADGVHLGRDDAPNLTQLRTQVADDFIVGITCRADAAFAQSALKGGADYISFGAVWATKSKPDVPAIGIHRLIKARQMFTDSHVCAIGGITIDNLAQVKAAGADCAAVISGLFAADDIEAEAARLIAVWNAS